MDLQRKQGDFFKNIGLKRCKHPYISIICLKHLFLLSTQEIEKRGVVDEKNILS